MRTNDTLTIQREQLDEYEKHKFETYASCIGLPPGQFPEVVQVEGRFGNGMPLHRTQFLRSWGAIQCAVYKQTFGCVELVIQND
jgi:hypothetical protein